MCTLSRPVTKILAFGSKTPNRGRARHITTPRPPIARKPKTRMAVSSELGFFDAVLLAGAAVGVHKADVKCVLRLDSPGEPTERTRRTGTCDSLIAPSWCGR